MGLGWITPALIGAIVGAAIKWVLEQVSTARMNARDDRVRFMQQRLAVTEEFLAEVYGFLEFFERIVESDERIEELEKTAAPGTVDRATTEPLKIEIAALRERFYAGKTRIAQKYAIICVVAPPLRECAKAVVDQIQASHPLRVDEGRINTLIDRFLTRASVELGVTKPRTGRFGRCIRKLTNVGRRLPRPHRRSKPDA